MCLNLWCKREEETAWIVLESSSALVIWPVRSSSSHTHCRDSIRIPKNSSISDTPAVELEREGGGLLGIERKSIFFSLLSVLQSSGASPDYKHKAGHLMQKAASDQHKVRIWHFLNRREDGYNLALLFLRSLHMPSSGLLWNDLRPEDISLKP